MGCQSHAPPIPPSCGGCNRELTMCTGALSRALRPWLSYLQGSQIVSTCSAGI